MLRNRTLSGIYHFSGDKDVSWSSFARRIIKLSRHNTTIKDIKTSDYGYVSKRPLNSRLDCTKTLHELQIPQPEWHSHLSDIVNELGSD